MKYILYFILALFALPAFATDVYYCHGVYTDSPCGVKHRVLLSVNAQEPNSDERAAALIRYYEGKMHLMAVAYDQREFELTKAYIQGTRVSQSTTVIGGGASSYAGAGGGMAFSGSNSAAISDATASADRTRNTFNFNRMHR